jgi:NACalpha-BTF3-like transcription factor
MTTIANNNQSSGISTPVIKRLSTLSTQIGGKGSIRRKAKTVNNHLPKKTPADIVTEILSKNDVRSPHELTGIMFVSDQASYQLGYGSPKVRMVSKAHLTVIDGIATKLNDSDLKLPEYAKMPSPEKDDNSTTTGTTDTTTSIIPTTSKPTMNKHQKKLTTQLLEKLSLVIVSEIRRVVFYIKKIPYACDNPNKVYQLIGTDTFFIFGKIEPFNTNVLLANAAKMFNNEATSVGGLSAEDNSDGTDSDIPQLMETMLTRNHIDERSDESVVRTVAGGDCMDQAHDMVCPDNSCEQYADYLGDREDVDTTISGTDAILERTKVVDVTATVAATAATAAAAAATVAAGVITDVLTKATFSDNDVELVAFQVSKSKEIARQTLMNCNGDIVEAILSLS